jgi:hypothetical protein
MAEKEFKQVAKHPKLRAAEKKLAAHVREAAHILHLDDATVDKAIADTYTMFDFAMDAAQALQAVGSELPLASNIVGACSVIAEITGDVRRHEYARSVSAVIAGTAEEAGDLVGFGAGDAGREIVREAVVLTVGEKYAPQKSGLRQLGEDAAHLEQKHRHKKPAPPQKP